MLDRYSVQEYSPHFQFLTSLLFYIERKFFEELSSHLILQDPESFKSTSMSADELPAPARGKIRYISGYVLAKLKHNLSMKIRNSLFTEGDNTKVLKLQSQMNILNSLCISYDELINSTKDIDSLQETRRKQNERESLTNLTDTSFEFFMKLETLCRRKLTHFSLIHYGKHLFSNMIAELLSDSELFELWFETLSNNFVVTYVTSDDENIGSMLHSVVTCCENFVELYHSVVQLFLKVAFSQFRRDFLSFLKKEKGKALRKKVMEKSRKTVKAFNMQFLKDDKSQEKISSYLRLKSEVVMNEKFLLSFTKKDLLLLCQMYDLQMPSRKRKDEISINLNRVILQSDSIPCPNKFQTSCLSDKRPCSVPEDEDVPGPSGYIPRPPLSTPSVTSDSNSSVSRHLPTRIPRECQSKRRRTVGKGKGKGKGRGKKKTPAAIVYGSDENCTMCNGQYVNGEDWISCDICNLWYHRKCVNIQDEEEWCDVNEGVFTCPLCQ